MQDKVLLPSHIKCIIAESAPNTARIRYKAFEFTVRKMIEFREVIALVNNVISLCVDADGGVRWEMLDFAFKKSIVETYAYVEFPDDIEETYTFLYTTDVYEIVCSNINGEQLSHIKKSIEIALDRQINWT